MAMIQGLRSFLYNIWLYSSGIICGTLFLPLILFGQRGVMLAVRTWAKVVRFGLRWVGGVKTELRGREHLPDGAMIYAGKHQSTYDVIVPFILVSAPAAIMKRELLWYPFFGWYALFGKMIPIDRDAKVSSVRKMRELAKVRISQGRQVLIFPEGTRHAPGAEPQYKSGVFGLYQSLETPLVPVATNSGLFWGRGFGVRPGTAVYEVLEPIEPGLDRAALMARLTTSLEVASTRLMEEGLAQKAKR